MEKLKIYNAKVILPERIIENGGILAVDGRIQEVFEGDITAEDFRAVDALGDYLSPGFIDIHVHGSGGYDCMDNTRESFIGLAQSELRHGATTVIPTSIACSHTKLKEFVQLFEQVRQASFTGADMPGLHLEGPYIAPSQKGALEEQYITPYIENEYSEILDLSSNIIRWSAAPEIPGAEKFAKALTRKGILCSFAHTDCDCATAERAIDWGFTHATHLYSAMSGVTRVKGIRQAGMIEAVYLRDEISAEIICDGMHLPTELIRLAYKLKGADKTVLITDAMRAAGLPEGRYPFGEREVIVERGVAWLPDFEAFAGSVATPEICVRTVYKKCGIPLCDAVKMMSLTPARICSLSADRGSIERGKNADLVIFDDDIRVKSVYRNGEEIIL